uniref:Uncharacterized protein n=1 Tax=Zea mays TaxID=4577 RepID=C0PEA0_MAIZE|nr:unknown [Zea mays]
MVSVLPEAVGVGQLPVAGEVQARHDDQAPGEGQPREAPSVGPERVARRVVPVGVLGQVRLPVPVPVLERHEVLAVQPPLRLRALGAAEHGVQQHVAAHADPGHGRADGHVVGDVAAGAVPRQEHAGAPARAAAEGRLRRRPLERRPPVVVRARVPVLRGAPVVHRHHHALAQPHQPPAQVVVDGRAGRRVREAAAVEEEDDRERRRRRRRAAEEVQDGQGGAAAAVVVGGGAVDADLQAGRRVDHVVEGGDPLLGPRVGRHPPVQELGQVAVEGAVRPPEHVVRQLEVGDEDPCVDRHRPLHNHTTQQQQGTNISSNRQFLSNTQTSSSSHTHTHATLLFCSFVRTAMRAATGPSAAACHCQQKRWKLWQ